MAIREQKGWVWTAEEKEWIKTWEREIKIVSRRLSEQVERFHSAVPAFAEEAVLTAQPFLTGTERLLALADGAARRKYQPLSADEAKLLLRDVHAHLSTWSAFTHRPDVQTAIRGANGQIDAQKRAQQKQRRAVRAQMDPQLKSPEFAQTVDGYVAQFFKATETMATFAHGLFCQKPFATDADCPIVQRLLVVHFIRSYYQFNPTISKALEQFVCRQPAPSLAAVVRHAHAVVIEDHWNYVLSVRSGSGPQLSIQELFTGHLQVTFDGLLKSIEQWKKQGLSLRSLSQDYFTILGVDYSLAAHPEVYPTDTSVISPEAANKLLDSFIEEA